MPFYGVLSHSEAQTQKGGPWAAPSRKKRLEAAQKALRRYAPEHGHVGDADPGPRWPGKGRRTADALVGSGLTNRGQWTPSRPV